MQYQLVIQFRPKTGPEFEKLIEIEDALVEELGDAAFVDGHDIGSGEFNIFIFTDSPNGSFQRVQTLLQAIEPHGDMNVAYRERPSGDYVVLWPPNFAAFTIV